MNDQDETQDFVAPVVLKVTAAKGDDGMPFNLLRESKHFAWLMDRDAYITVSEDEEGKHFRMRSPSGQGNDPAWEDGEKKVVKITPDGNHELLDSWG